MRPQIPGFDALDPGDGAGAIDRLPQYPCRMTPNLLLDIDGRPLAGIDPADRGLAYGDGLFETLLVHRGRPVWWEAHWARLCRGCEALGLPEPSQAAIRAQAEALVAGRAHAVLKLQLTRGAGGRGYAPPAAPQPLLILSLHPAPQAAPAEGLVLRWCDTRLAIQPRLAGIKHLNRLEQVLARREWDHPGIHEGLMQDTDGHVVCATAANLFAHVGGAWMTPPVDRCGIAGVCRDWLLAHLPVEERRLSPEDVLSASAVFLASSVRGVMPVRQLEGRRWERLDAAIEVAAQLEALEPAFAPARG